MLRFFVLRFFTGKRSKTKSYECDGLGNPIHYKMMFVSAKLVKTVGEDEFLVAKGQFLRGREKHIVT